MLYSGSKKRLENTHRKKSCPRVFLCKHKNAYPDLLMSSDMHYKVDQTGVEPVSENEFPLLLLS